MGLKTPVVNGARQDLPCLESPEVNGARQPIASVKKYVNNAWQEIWSAVKDLLRSQSDYNQSYSRSVTDSGSAFVFSRSSPETTGTTDFYFLTEESEFTDASIQFSYSGGLSTFRSSTGVWSPSYLGHLYVVGIDKSGNEITIKNVGSVGNTSGDTSGDVEVVGSGTFKQVGLKFTPKYMNPSTQYKNRLSISPIYIDGKKYIA